MGAFKLYLTGTLMLLGLGSQAQMGGKDTYAFLNLTGSARVAALGGNALSVTDNDVNLGFYNPALLSKSQDQQLSLNLVNHFAGINFGHASYAKHYDSLATFAGSIQYINYGKFDQTTPGGEVLGTFTAGEYAVQLGAGRAIDSMWSIGANAKILLSSFETYTSFGASVDLAVAYNNTKRLYGAGFLVKHIGTQVIAYEKGRRESLPFEIQAAVSKKFGHAPLRLGLGLENLQKWNLRFVDPDPQPVIDQLTGDTIIDDKSHFGDKLMRHVVLNAEILLTENFHVRFGYNYRKRQELRIVEKPGFAGISWGFGLKISRFHLAYGRSIFSLAGGSNHITVSTNLAQGRTRN